MTQRTQWSIDHETCIGKSRCCLLVSRVASLKTERFACCAGDGQPIPGLRGRYRSRGAIDLVLVESAWRGPLLVS